MADVIMPKMSDAMTEGRVLSWRKRAGEPVRRGEPIAEIETDKVNVEIDAEADGTLADIVVPEGGTAPVGAVIAHINGAPGRPAPSPSRPEERRPRPQPAQSNAGAQAQPQPQPHPDKATAPPQPQSQSAAAEAPPSEPRKAEQPKAPAAARGGAHVERLQPRAPEPHHDGEPAKASPLARRLARERGVDLAAVRGTGPGGRIVERDVLAHAEGGAEEKAAAAPGPERRPAEAAAKPEPRAARDDFEDVELPRMRQAIALSVARSMQVTPHFYVTAAIDMGRALDVRAQLKEAYGDTEGHVTINDLILKAAALALRRHPDLNAQFIEPKTVRRFHRVHLGIMVAVPDGLVVPVLRDADRLTLLEVAREARRLIEAAKRGQLRYEDYSGATFSVSNLGMYPIAEFAAIINAPQAGILAVGRAEERAVVRAGQVVARPTLDATISADHRVTDGVGAAALLAEVKRLLENPLRLMAG